jgi:tetratricopeptide (TPR) repeat protein
MIADNNEKENTSIEFTNDNWIVIGGSSFVFSGQYSKSTNGTYILAWDDAMVNVDENTGKEEFMNGEYLLLENQKLILHGIMRRPNDGKVADNGTFIFNDWIGFSGGVNGKGLESNFYAYNKKGEIIINHYYSANLVNNGLSNNGRFAICQTAHSDTSDADSITCFDLTEGKLLWKKIPETRRADAFEFEENNIYLVYDNIGKFKYSFSGKFLDDEKWYKARVEHGSAFDLIEIADKKLSGVGKLSDPNQLKEILNLYLQAITRGFSPYYLARTHRKAGEIYEQLGEIDKAIYQYEQALKLDPHVGIKKKLQILKPEKPGIGVKEKPLPYKINHIHANNSIHLEDTRKGVEAGHAPRGTYFQIDHYDDACWYIKNHYISGLDKGTSTISITKNSGELLKIVELNHLVFKIKRAAKSNYFAAISYDLQVYLYSPNFDLVATRKISKNADNRYEIKQVDVSPNGNFVIIAKNDKATIYDRDLIKSNMKEMSSPAKNRTNSVSISLSLNDEGSIEVSYDSETADNISTVQVFDENDVYIGTYSGKVKKLTENGSYKSMYTCNSPIRGIKKNNPYLFIICDKFIDVLKEDKKINRIERFEGFGRLIWGDIAWLEILGRIVRLYSLPGIFISELEFLDTIPDSYLYGNNLKVFTSNKYYIFNFSV